MRLIDVRQAGNFSDIKFIGSCAPPERNRFLINCSQLHGEIVDKSDQSRWNSVVSPARTSILLDSEAPSFSRQFIKFAAAGCLRLLNIAERELNSSRRFGEHPVHTYRNHGRSKNPQNIKITTTMITVIGSFLFTSQCLANCLNPSYKFSILFYQLSVIQNLPKPEKALKGIDFIYKVEVWMRKHLQSRL